MNVTCRLLSRLLITLCALLNVSTSRADIITFEFTGRLTVINNAGDLVIDSSVTDFDPYGIQSPIASTFTYDTVTGLGSAALVFTPFTFLGEPVEIYDVSMQQVSGTPYVLGNMLANFSATYGIPVSLMWNASGLFNAIDYGLQSGDVISGTNLIRGGNIIYDVNSALPASDGMVYSVSAGRGLYNTWTIDQGPAPLATTTFNTTTLCTPFVDCMGNALSAAAGFTDDGVAGSPLVDNPFPGMQVSLDIGSGNSLTVLSISQVPLPAAAWLFSAGLLGLFGIARPRS